MLSDLELERKAAAIRDVRGTGFYETRPFLSSTRGFTVLDPIDAFDELAINTPGLILSIREAEPFEWINSLFPEHPEVTQDEEDQAYLDDIIFRYRCVCPQWEDARHDEVLCREYIAGEWS